jgi:hypothetical protein
LAGVVLVLLLLDPTRDVWPVLCLLVLAVGLLAVGLLARRLQQSRRRVQLAARPF